MKIIHYSLNFLAITFLCLCFLTITVRAQSSAETEKELLRIQDDWAAARVNRDVAFLEKLYAKEFRITSMNGSVVERDADIAVFKSGDLKPELVKDDDMSVLLYDKFAVVTGREQLKGTYKGHTGEFTLRFTNVFVQRDGRWQLITHHATEVKKKAEK